VNDEVARPESRQARLHRPWRALIAVAEVALAAVASWGAVICWQLGVRTLTVTLSDGTVLTSTRYLGSWLTGSLALGMLAAILLMDAVREVVLAIRAKPRPQPEAEETEESVGDYVAHLNGG
jgi:fucose 4-O-acetylase-like acetyltransferase